MISSWMCPCALVDLAQGQQRLDALPARLPDADQDSRSEGHLLLSGEPDGLKAGGGVLIGRAVVDLPLPHQPRRHALEHDSLRDRDLAQEGDVLGGHDAGVGVGQQPRLLRHDARDLGQVGDGRLVAERGQLFARHLVAQLGLVAEGEERLRTACGSAGAGDFQHLVDAHVGALAAPGRLREGAVVANVAAELGQGNEDVA